VAQSLSVDLDAWDAWSPAEAARHLEGLEAPWYVIGGWGLDLFLGEQTRDHEDLEIGIPDRAFLEVRDVLAGFELVVVGDGKAWPLTDESIALHRQSWVREPAGPWRLDVMREPWDGRTWICRRDPRIRMSAGRLVGHTADGIPYAQPEVVLLFKAKSVRPKDEADFANVLPRLDRDRRAWLRDALALVHPGHRWLEVLGTG
jgi:hypothetical protein